LDRLGEVRLSLSEVHERLTRLGRGERMREEAIERLVPAAERQALREMFGERGPSEWDEGAGLARFKKGIERLRDDPAEQRRIDEIIAAVPPRTSLVRSPLAKEPPTEKLSQQLGGKIEINNSLINHSPTKDEHGKGRIDLPVRFPLTRHEPGKGEVDRPLIERPLIEFTPTITDEHGKIQIKGKDESGGKGKTQK
jgi:hypothetical protein